MDKLHSPVPPPLYRQADHDSVYTANKTLIDTPSHMDECFFCGDVGVFYEPGTYRVFCDDECRDAYTDITPHSFYTLVDESVY